MIGGAGVGGERMAEARRILKRRFGYDAFRGVQAPAIRRVLSGGDVLVLMPTGGGKSLCYQIPALVLGGVTLVVSPLISLMEDQVAGLRRRGVAAAAIHSGVAVGEAAEVVSAAVAGDLRLLYVAPERFDSAGFRSRLAELPVSLFVVDEAHCVADWGESFRPAYLRLGRVRESLRCASLALTATATPEARGEIIRRLRLRSPRVLAGGFDRPNLWWGAETPRSREERDRRIMACVGAPREGVALVYASTRREADQLADRLNRAGLRAAGYHAGVSVAERQVLQRRFMAGELPVMVATSAFGMGIDKRDVRLVVHAQPPGSLEAYYQEAGRAGRDGGAAVCRLLCVRSDAATQRFLLEQAHPGPRLVRAVHRALAALPGGAAGGRPVALDPDALARAVPGVRGVAQLEAALRVLERAGALERRGVRWSAGRFRLLASSPSAALDALARSGPAGPWAAGSGARERAALTVLVAAGDGPRLCAGRAVPWRSLVRELGGPAPATDALERLSSRGLVEWTRPARESVRLMPGRPGRPRVDWTALRRARREALGRLDRVLEYARGRGCRRARLLRHFGQSAPRHCDYCDRCVSVDR